MPTMMEPQRVSIAQLVQNVAFEITANRFSDSPQYLSAFRLASALINLEMANELPVAVQRLRALQLDSIDYDDVCRIFCNISRVSEEIGRYQRRLQSAHLTIEHARPALRSMSRYLQARRAQTLDYRTEAFAIRVPSFERRPDLSETDVRRVHGQLSSYREIFDEIASTFELISETFDDELYHPYMDQRLGDGELQQVGEALDAINMCLQEGYNAACVGKRFVMWKTGPYAERLVDMHRVRSQGRPFNLEAHTQSDIVEQEDAETVPPASLEEDDGDQPGAAPRQRNIIEEKEAETVAPASLEGDNQAVAALRSELERTLGAPASNFRPLTSAGTESSSDHVRSRAETATKAESASKAKPSAVGAANRPVHGIRSAPLYAGSVTSSFSVVEEVVHRRGHHNRAATLESASNYATTETGMSQLGSVIRTHGRSVPRVFTGSFNELEAGMSRLRVESRSGSAARRPNAEEAIIVRDFATPTSTTPGTPASIPPSPAALHYRREALLAREAEVTPHSAARSQQARGHLHRDGARSTTAESTEAGPSRSDSSKRRRENTI